MKLIAGHYELVLCHPGSETETAGTETPHLVRERGRYIHWHGVMGTGDCRNDRMMESLNGVLMYM